MRNIFIVNVAQVVVSQDHPEGAYSKYTGYPKTYDSRSYPAADGSPDGDSAAALNAAKSDYFGRMSSFYSGSENRVMWTVTLETAQGRQVMAASEGVFPNMNPPQPEPEAEEE